LRSPEVIPGRLQNPPMVRAGRSSASSNTCAQ
jgi:hypothetical protein